MVDKYSYKFTGRLGEEVARLFRPSVFSKEYGGKMGVREVKAMEGYDDLETWYPKRKREDFRDIDEVREIQVKAFDAYGPKEPMKQVLLDGNGIIYVDQNLNPDIRYIPEIRIYQVVLTKELDMERVYEELRMNDIAISEGQPHNYIYQYTYEVSKHYFIDHHGLGDDFSFGDGRAELYEIAKRPGADNMGITVPFLRLVKQTHEQKYGKTDWWTIVRANNIRCQRALQKSFRGIAITRIQAPPDPKMRYHSKESNFGMNTGIRIRSNFVDSQPRIWKPGDPAPTGEDFLIRMPQGDQAKLESWWPHFRMLENGILPVGRAPVMGEHYVGTALSWQEVNNLGIDSEYSSYLAFTMNWKNR